jgi:hypothetical protein
MPPELVPLTSDSSELEAWECGKKLAEAQNFTRILAGIWHNFVSLYLETPSNLMTPSIFVERALEKLSPFENIKLHVHDKDW